MVGKRRERCVGRALGSVALLLALLTGDALAQGVGVGTRVGMSDGETLTVTGGSLVLGELITDGTTTIRFGPDTPDGRVWVWLLDGGKGVAGTLVIDGSGGDGGDALGDSWSGQTVNLAEDGEPGRSITLCIVFLEGEIELMERIADGQGVVPGRLRIVSRGGNGGHGTLRYSHNNAELRNGANGGAGGNVRLRLLMWKAEGDSEWSRSREIETGGLQAWSQRFGVDVDSSGGAAGQGTARVNVGRQRPLWLAAGRNGVDGDDGRIELEIATLSSAQTRALRVLSEQAAALRAGLRQLGIGDSAAAPSERARRDACDTAAKIFARLLSPQYRGLDEWFDSMALEDRARIEDELAGAFAEYGNLYLYARRSVGNFITRCRAQLP